ncbi:glutathione S-transferase [Macrolepiota fuliginosa MF-IS2]|uniref:glutathione transferase n=1 Tax=Macrolepiota fuliginosa MF-IS2 TaxID=1400762 RepID=A0A9P5XM49_9AGAR|nr:glutathione S-transferase [Macrolepiota fuliginosa MF-IS2]
MVLKVYGYAKSTAVKPVIAVLYEKKIPFELISVDLMKGENKTPEYLAKQPFGQIPVIDDNGFILYESRAIARYLEENYPNHGTKLLPSDPKKRALVDQAASVEAFSFDYHATPIVIEVIYKPNFYGQPTDPKKVAESKASLDSKLDVYEQILSKQKYIAGDEFTLADLFHLTIGTRLIEGGINFIEGRPNITRWWNDIYNRESWQKVLKDAA